MDLSRKVYVVTTAQSADSKAGKRRAAPAEEDRRDRVSRVIPVTSARDGQKSLDSIATELESSRVCQGSCGALLPLDAFATAPHLAEGRSPTCRRCEAVGRAGAHYRKPTGTGGRATVANPPSVESKWCPDCERDLPASEFHRNCRTRSGLQTYCRSCQITRVRGISRQPEENAFSPEDWTSLESVAEGAIALDPEIAEFPPRSVEIELGRALEEVVQAAGRKVPSSARAVLERWRLDVKGWLD